MPQKPSDPVRKTLRVERRAARVAPGSVRWVKGLLGRPLVLEGRGAQMHLKLVDRRRAPAVIETEELRALRAELRARLLEHDNRHAAAVMRQLVLVHDVLGRQGWAGVAGMDSRVLHKAQVQAQMLEGQEPSRRMADFTDRLTMLQVAASVREDQNGGIRPGEPRLHTDTTPLKTQPGRSTPAVLDADQSLEVSIGSPEEFDAIRRGWMDTVSPAEEAKAEADLDAGTSVAGDAPHRSD